MSDDQDETDVNAETFEEKLEEIDIIPTKKRPGRPPKVIIKKAIPRLGIVKEASNATSVNDPRLINVFELLYENPMMFKKIFGLYKSMTVECVRIRCEQNCMKIHAKDNLEANDIYTIIYGHKMNRYYAGKVLEFGLGLSEIYKILQTLSKDHSKICIYTNVQYERHKIKIGMVDDDFEEEDINRVDMESIDEYDWDVEREIALEEDYPIKFELPFKKFKKKVNDFKLLGDIMKIEKHGVGPLKLNHVFTSNKGDRSTSFKNPSKVNLISLIEPNDIFSVSVNLDHIKPLAGSLITDTIQISASCSSDSEINHKIIFTALLDHDIKNKKKVYGTEKCQIKILTKIVRA